jgi:excisionase family DNA binding protein
VRILKPNYKNIKMETKDFTILRQLSDEAQMKIELKLTVRELFAYAKYLIVDEDPRITETVQQSAVPVDEYPKTEAPKAVQPDVVQQSKPARTTKRKQQKAKEKPEMSENIQAVIPKNEVLEEPEPEPEPELKSEPKSEPETESEAEVVDGIVYYRVKDVADVYNVNVITVYTWINKGVLKYHHKKGKQMFFAKEDVEKLKRKRNTKKKIKKE